MKKVRIIKYRINDYILATNLFSDSYDFIKNIYRDRWRIEEYFKYAKYNFSFFTYE